MHVPCAAGHKRHVCMKVVDVPTGHMLRHRKMKLFVVIGTKGGCVLFMLAAVHDLKGATRRHFCDFNDVFLI